MRNLGSIWCELYRWYQLSHLPPHKNTWPVYVLQDTRRLWCSYCGFRTTGTVTFLVVKTLTSWQIFSWQCGSMEDLTPIMPYSNYYPAVCVLLPAEISSHEWCLDLQERTLSNDGLVPFSKIVWSVCPLLLSLELADCNYDRAENLPKYPRHRKTYQRWDMHHEIRRSFMHAFVHSCMHY
jgi:hypothetical protein